MFPSFTLVYTEEVLRESGKLVWYGLLKEESHFRVKAHI